MNWTLRALLLVAALTAGPADATTVRSVALGDMLADAELVFEGRVLAATTRGGRRGIETCAEFEVSEVLSGPPVASPLTLCFAGGSAGDRHYGIAGLEIPAPGEHGIYFVESLDQPRLNPLYGWSQGHFRVEPGDGVQTSTGVPVTDLSDGSAEPVRGPSEGVARGVRTGLPRRRGGDGRGLDPAAFKARLRALHGRPRAQQGGRP